VQVGKSEAVELTGDERELLPIGDVAKQSNQGAVGGLA
jgi:hypothetical protein